MHCIDISAQQLSGHASSFGQPGTNYDFSKVDIQELKQTAVNLEAEQKGMKKKVNPRAVSMLDK